MPILKSLDGPRGYDYVLETKIRRGLVFGPTFLEHDRFAVFSSKFGVQTPDFI